MPFNNQTKTEEYIRSFLHDNGILGDIRSLAKKDFIPILMPEAAAFLRQLIILKNPKTVLEIGTGIGYSGHIILLNSAAHLYTIEHNEKSMLTAKGFFNKSGLNSRVTFYFDDESHVIPLLSGTFDFIFLDGAKTRYCAHLPFLKKLLNKGGALLADNVLFGGMVSGLNKNVGKKQSIVDGLKSFLSALYADPDFSTSILNIGDGMSLSIKN